MAYWIRTLVTATRPGTARPRYERFVLIRPSDTEGRIPGISDNKKIDARTRTRRDGRSVGDVG
jgi:hypothetical protein